MSGALKARADAGGAEANVSRKAAAAATLNKRRAAGWDAALLKTESPKRVLFQDFDCIGSFQGISVGESAGDGQLDLTQEF